MASFDLLACRRDLRAIDVVRTGSTKAVLGSLANWVWVYAIQGVAIRGIRICARRSLVSIPRPRHTGVHPDDHHIELSIFQQGPGIAILDTDGGTLKQNLRYSVKRTDAAVSNFLDSKFIAKACCHSIKLFHPRRTGPSTPFSHCARRHPGLLGNVFLRDALFINLLPKPANKTVFLSASLLLFLIFRHVGRSVQLTTLGCLYSAQHLER